MKDNKPQEPTDGFRADQKQIDEWKKKHGEVHAVEVKDNEGNTKRAYFRKADRPTLSAAMKFGSSDPMKFNDTLFTNCWLAGDDVIKTDDDMYLAASTAFAGTVKIREAELKKL